jgi:hypothetical protein
VARAALLVALVGFAGIAGIAALAGLAGIAMPARPASAADAASDLDRVLRDPRITESSGLVASTEHAGVVWTHNDSGHPPQLFAVGPDGRTRATLTLNGAPSRDWEAIAPGRDAAGRALLWVGDIGDNRSSWPYVRLYRVEEPATLADRPVSWTGYRLRYEDGPHNAETLLVDPRTQRMFVVTKAATGAGVYAVPPDLAAPPAVNVLRRVADAPSTVTDGAFSPDGAHVVLVGYVYGYLYGRGPLDPGAAAPVPVASGPTTFLPPLRPQGESVTWTADGRTLLVGSEGADSAVRRIAAEPLLDPARSTGADSSPPAASAPLPDVRAAGPSAGMVTLAATGLLGLLALAGLTLSSRISRRRGDSSSV